MHLFASTAISFMYTNTAFSCECSFQHDVALLLMRQRMSECRAFSPTDLHVTCMQVTVAILLNNFLGAIQSAEVDAAEAASAGLRSKEMLRSVNT
jgi:hypothetical protein